jgi:hypothetical protein
VEANVDDASGAEEVKVDGEVEEAKAGGSNYTVMTAGEDCGLFYLMLFFSAYEAKEPWEGLLQKVTSKCDVVATSVLGSGATATVYGTGNREQVLKVVSGTELSSLWTEVDMLRELHVGTNGEVKACLPTCIKHGTVTVADVMSGYLLLSPVGTHFTYRSPSPFSLSHAVDILRVLQHAHARYIVHRDARFANVLLRTVLALSTVPEDGDAVTCGSVSVSSSTSALSRSRAMLIDWGFAVKFTGHASAFAGTLRFASPRVLESRIQWLAGGGYGAHMHVAHPWDDVQSWIRLCFVLTYPQAKAHLDAVLWNVDSMQGLRALDAWWCEVLAVGSWRQLLAALPSAEVVDAMAQRKQLLDASVYTALEACVANVVMPWV